jgi:hypothetical protein
VPGGEAMKWYITLALLALSVYVNLNLLAYIAVMP